MLAGKLNGPKTARRVSEEGLIPIRAAIIAVRSLPSHMT